MWIFSIIFNLNYITYPKVKIEKLVFGGQGLGRLDNKVYFVWNALPGETVAVEVTKSKKNFTEGIAREIITSSPDRIEPAEAHFLSCSPWQIMTPEAENRFKIEVARDVFMRNGRLELPADLRLVSDLENFDHYRSKMEFGFTQANHQLSLAMVNRDTHQNISVDECCLAAAPITRRASELLTLLRQSNVELSSLRRLVIRVDSSDRCVADLFVSAPIKSFPLAPADRPDWLRLISDDMNSLPMTTSVELTEEIMGVKMAFDPEVFFQINLPLFLEVIDRIAQFIPDGSEVIDCFAGVGALSLPFAGRLKKLTLIEGDERSCVYAVKNIESNNIMNASVLNAPAEKLAGIKLRGRVVLLDPPRTGLSPAAVDAILSDEPKTIIYLSCDPATQARDIFLLSAKYHMEHCELFNFFPRTPHIESLVVLTLNS
ncbi:TPA: hypothetical protein DF272_02210 [Candidatus Falkowbacteria bacterium]|nr:hypothetical protein [Candidatus Falkowbacteria bacterium]